MIDRFQGEYRWLSNFWPARVVWDNQAYPTVENAYQAAKCPPHYRNQFYTCPPGWAKRMGIDWPPLAMDDKLECMRRLLYQKFSDATLRAKLDATDTQELIEGNEWGDRFWGVYYRRDGTSDGENQLGKLLMEVRLLG